MMTVDTSFTFPHLSGETLRQTYRRSAFKFIIQIEIFALNIFWTVDKWKVCEVCVFEWWCCLWARVSWDRVTPGWGVVTWWHHSPLSPHCIDHSLSQNYFEPNNNTKLFELIRHNISCCFLSLRQDGIPQDFGHISLPLHCYAMVSPSYFFTIFPPLRSNSQMCQSSELAGGRKHEAQCLQTSPKLWHVARIAAANGCHFVLPRHIPPLRGRSPLFTVDIGAS